MFAFIVRLIIQLVIAVAVSYASAALQRKNRPEARKIGVRGSTSSGGTAPGTFIMGRYVTAGHQVAPRLTWGVSGGTPNEYLVDVIALSCLPVRGLAGMLVDNQDVTISGTLDGERGFPITNYTVGGVHHMWVLFFDGSQTTASSYLMARLAGHPKFPWASDMIGRGVAYAVVTARINRTLFNRLPEYKFIVDGIPLADTRTPVVHDNPVMGIRTILKGLSYGGAHLYGPQGISDFAIPQALWQAEADKCDVSNSAYGGRRFRFGLEVSVDAQPHEVIDEILSAAAARIACIGGTYKILVSEPNASVASFTDEDIVISEGQTYEPFPGLESVHNAISATYPEPAAQWQMKEAPLRVDTAAVTSDDNRNLVANVEFKAVPYPVQAQQLSWQMMREMRRFRRHTFTAPPEWWQYEPLDAVSWTSARNGYSAKLFIVAAIDDLPNGFQVPALQEQDASDYNWSSDFELPFTTTPAEPDRPPAQAMAGFTVSGSSIPDAGGTGRRPTLLIGYAGELADVRAVQVQARVQATGTVVFDDDLPYDPSVASPAHLLNGEFLPATGYEARARFVPFSARQTDWSSWVAATTPDLRIVAPDIADNAISADGSLFVADAAITTISGSAGFFYDVPGMSQTLTIEPGEKLFVVAMAVHGAVANIQVMRLTIDNEPVVGAEFYTRYRADNGGTRSNTVTLPAIIAPAAGVRTIRMQVNGGSTLAARSLTIMRFRR